MATQSAPGGAVVLPREGARVAIASDGSVAAVIEDDAIAFVELGAGALVGKLACDRAAARTDAAWLGSRLLVLACHAEHSELTLVEPAGAAVTAQLAIATALELGPAVAERALALATASGVVITAVGDRLMQAPLPIRTRPLATGIVAGHVMVALETSIEEWDLARRLPRRRLRLPRAATITALGGSERVVWLTTEQDPQRLDVVRLVQRGQPIAHELPEPIAQVAGPVQGDLVVCVGAHTGQLYLLDLDGRRAMQPFLPDGLERVARVALSPERAVALEPGRPLVVVELAGRERQVIGAPPLVASPLAGSGPELPAAAPGAVLPPELTAGRSQPVPVPALVPGGPVPSPDEPARPLEIPAEPPACLGPVASTATCSPGEHAAVLEHYRRYVAAIAARAIAEDWNTGKLATTADGRPPGESEVLAITGRRSGLAAPQLAEAEAALAAAEDELRAARAHLAGRATPFDRLCSEHGIGELGQLVLLLVTAPALWGELARLYAILANDQVRATCDEHLLWQLLGAAASRQEIARELEPRAPLVRLGLVRAAGTHAPPFQPLAADPVVIKLLAGEPVAHDADAGAERVTATVALDAFVAPRGVVSRALHELAVAPAGNGRIVVRGRTGSGRRTLLAALGALAGRGLVTIDTSALVRDRRLDALRDLLRRAHLRGQLPCLDGLDAIASDDATSRAFVRELVRDHEGPVALRLPPHAQPPLDPGYVAIELPTASIAERAEQWRGALAARGLAVRDVDALAARFAVGAGIVHRVADAVARAADPGALVDAALDAALRQHVGDRLSAVATKVDHLAEWAQVVLPADVQDSVRELLSRIRHRRTVFETWGMGDVITTSRGVTALFQGGPGTGKTLVAGAIARELGLDLYRIDLSRVVSKWIGETEQNLAKVFDAAEEGPAMLLFDEADSLFAKRTEVKTSVDRYANLEVNFLLQRLDTFEGVAILTTNFGSSIDAAFKRRLSCSLTFPFPDEEARERLWRVHLPASLPRTGKLDLAGLARRYQMSGGYIRNAVLRAAFLAAEERTTLAQSHLERAIRAEFRELGKLGESGVLE